MSELQTALLAIGIAVVIAVYAFGWWQQKQYRRRFGNPVRSNQADPLYNPADTSPSSKDNFAKDKTAHQPVVLPQVVDDVIEKAVPEIHHEPIVAHKQENFSVSHEENHVETQHEQTPPSETVEPVVTHKVEPSKPDEQHALLNPYSDFIIDLYLAEPAPPSVLSSLWQRKFDFGKPIQVFGLTLAHPAHDNNPNHSAVQELTESWEKVIADSHSLYVAFRIALQMVDRGGAIGVAKLTDLRDLLKGIAKKVDAELEMPDVQTSHQYAVQLDQYCASVDQLVGINLIPPGDRLLQGKRIAHAAAAQGMTLESDGAFHMLDGFGHSLFRLENKTGEQFQHYNIDNVNAEGVTLLLDVPRVANPADQFERMVHVAHALTKELQVDMVDDHMVVLTEASLQRIFDQILDVEDKMLNSSITPGSAQARRLFV